MYESEEAVGAAAASGIARGKLFVTTKAWHDKLSLEAEIRNAFDS